MKKGLEQLPLRRRSGLVVEDFYGELLVYDLERHAAHCLNETAACVWKSSNGKRSVAELASMLYRKFGQAVDEDVVLLALFQLDKFHLLERAERERVWTVTVSRRELVRKLALTTLVAVPLVTTMAAPTAADAATCRGLGVACSTNSQCCSTLCVGGQCVCMGSCSACTADAQCCSGRCGSALNKCLPCA